MSSILDLRALASGIAGSVLGVPVTVTRPAPDDTPVDTQGIWTTAVEEVPPYGSDLRRLDRRRLMSVVATDTLTDLPRGTLIVAEELPGVSRTWRVEGYAHPVRPETIPVVLVPVN